MNDERRKKLEKAKVLIDDARNLIEEIYTDEKEAFDNLHEELQQSEKGGKMEENVGAFDWAMNTLDGITSELDAIE